MAKFYDLTGDLVRNRVPSLPVKRLADQYRRGLVVFSSDGKLYGVGLEGDRLAVRAIAALVAHRNQQAAGKP